MKLEHRKKQNYDTLFKEGQVIMIKGLQGSGKTDKVVYFMEQGVTYGYHCHTIINFFKTKDVGKAIKLGKLRPGITYREKPPEIKIFRSLSELLMNLLMHDKNIVFLDESGLFATATRGTSSAVTTLKLLTYIIRHFDASIVFICQSQNSIVPELRSTLLTYRVTISKKSANNRSMIIEKPLRSGVDDENMEYVAVTKPVDNMPSSQLAYDGKYLPAFRIDIDLNLLLDELAKHTSVELREDDVGVNIIKKLVEEQEYKKAHKRGYKKEMISKIIQDDPALTTKEIVSKMGELGEEVNRTYVSNIRNSMGISDVLE